MNCDVTRPADGTVVIRPSGRLTMVAAPALREVIADAVDDSGPRLVIDLSDTEFIDSSGLGALVAGLKTAREAGGDLRIAAATPQVVAALQLTNLHRVLKPYPSVDECLARP